MRSLRTEEFDEQRRRLALRFTCDECGHFVARENACAHGWPIDLHRRARYDLPTRDVVFCKEFEVR